LPTLLKEGSSYKLDFFSYSRLQEKVDTVGYWYERYGINNFFLPINFITPLTPSIL